MDSGSLFVVLTVLSAGAAAIVAGRAARARAARVLLIVSALAASVAVGLLAVAFGAEDWSLVYVADNTRSELGLGIRLAGLWAGAEGSLLLWTAMVAWVAVIASARLDGATAAWSIRIGAGLVVGYGAIVAAVASPFERLDVPAVDGLGLQPVLEYPAMIWHPPILYAGLVGLLAPAIRAAALSLAGDRLSVDRSWMTAPMVLLTIGLTTGAIWANVELGWGGYWAWDPIESAGLVAWLCGAAAIHLSHGPGSDSTPISPRLVALVLVAPGVAALWATTLTRIGVVASVHAFADRPTMRATLLVVAGVASLAFVIAATSHGRRPDGPPSAAPSADGVAQRVGVARRSAAAVLCVAALFVAVGTYEPLVEAATSGDSVAIAGHYYTRLLWPVALLGTGLALWVDQHRRTALVGACLGAVLVPVAAGIPAVVLAAGGGAVAATALVARVPKWPASLAHLGVGVVLVGVAGTVGTAGFTADVATGATATIDGTTITNRGIELIEGSVTSEAVATVEVDGAAMRPRLVAYRLRGVSTAEVARRSDGFDELQVLLLDGDVDAARFRVTRLPRVRLVWVGAALVAAGLAAQLWRRFRAKSSDSVDPSPSPSPSVEAPLPASGSTSVVTGAAGVADGAGAVGATMGAAGVADDPEPGGA